MACGNIRRSDQAMMELILSTATEDGRIRAVILNGSRSNPNATPDRFQDFDIIYVVTDITSFTEDLTWIDRFGERMILQTPDLMGGEVPRKDDGFTYLMQFVDGSRIDLTLISLGHISDIEDESLSVLMVDKDDRFDPFPPPNEKSYLPNPPPPEKHMPITAMNFGGKRSMSPKDWREVKSCMRSTFWMVACENNS